MMPSCSPCYRILVINNYQLLKRSNEFQFVELSHHGIYALVNDCILHHDDLSVCIILFIDSLFFLSCLGVNDYKCTV